MDAMRKEGEVVDFDELVREVEAEEDQDVLRQVLERAQAQPLEAPVAVERDKRKLMYDKAQVLKSGKEKLARAAVRLKATLSFATKRQMQMKALYDARPQIIKNRDRVGFFSMEQLLKVQELVDRSIDWVRMYFKTAVEARA